MNTDGDHTLDATLSPRSIATVMAAETVETTVERAADVLEQFLEQRPSLWVYLCDPDEETIHRVISTAESDVDSSHSGAVDPDVPIWAALETNDVLRAADHHTLVPVSDAGVLRIDGPEVPGSAPIRKLAVVTVNAVEDRRQLSTQRAKLDRLEREIENLREFASIVSHDLRNPLSVARANFELAVETGEAESVERVQDAHDRIESIIKHTLTLTDEGQSLDTTPLSLEQLARDSWESVPTAQATLHVDSSRTIDGDPDRLRQLFENLFRNAIEHGQSTDDRSVAVRVGSLPDGFYVEDDGPGIPAGHREQVFERGYTATDDGTGIGLSIVEDVATEHGFDITITDGLDGGARFEFTRSD